jgi:hypothetical protein
MRPWPISSNDTPYRTRYAIVVRCSQKVHIKAAMQDPNIPYATTEAQLQALLAQFQQPILLDQRDKKISRHKFTPDEDELLRQLVAQYGQNEWASIAQHFESRTSRQCRDRWRHYINPQVMTGNWTEADDQLLLAKVAELGQRWSAIAQSFPGRTGIGVKYHYISITGRKTRDVAPRVPQSTIMLPLGQAAVGEQGAFSFGIPHSGQAGETVQPNGLQSRAVTGREAPEGQA